MENPEIRRLKSNCHNELPPFIIKDKAVISEKSAILECFNKHFVEAGSLFERQLLASNSTVTNCLNSSVLSLKSVVSKDAFCLPFSVADVQTALIV